MEKLLCTIIFDYHAAFSGGFSQNIKSSGLRLFGPVLPEQRHQYLCWFRCLLGAWIHGSWTRFTSCLKLLYLFVCVESLATSITDLFPRQLRKPGARELLVLAIAVVCFLLGLPLVTQGGIVLFHLMDTFGASGITLLFIACCETIAVAWIYGADRFYDNIEDMIGYPPLPLLKYCWLFITPLICGFTMLYNLAEGHAIMVYGYIPGVWAGVVGTLLILTPLMCIPVFIFISLCKNSRAMTTPSSDLRQARPQKPVLTLCGYVVFRARAQPHRRDDAQDKTNMEEMRGL
ncbi:hypothetical protein fugu_019738 [Takifugu bimaculatus]|uniref:Uncharacterized protein n=1 Tax=Takifugu bimaculatus TaxID=433685 RepID=A0A4Z2BI12_9TELE|nr:hypothetical protein fugu_019738 [Takifugu bimaculatus]